MKSISAAIIVLSGAILVASGVIGRGDQATFAMVSGLVVGAVGLIVWCIEFLPEGE